MARLVPAEPSAQESTATLRPAAPLYESDPRARMRQAIAATVQQASPVETFGAGMGAPLERGAYGLKSLFTNLSPEEQDRLDMANKVMSTPSGFAGAMVPEIAAFGPIYGNIASMPTLLANRATLSGLIGGAWEALTNPEDRGGAFKRGFVGGAVGSMVGQAATDVATARAARNLELQSQNAMRDAVAAQGRKEGFKFPPSQTGGGVTGRTLEGISGMRATEAAMSEANDRVVQRIAARSLGIKQINPAALDSVKAKAGKAYDALRAQGSFRFDDQFAQAVQKVGATNDAAASIIPSLRNPQVKALVEQTAGLAGRSMPADAVVTALKQLRYEAGKNIVSQEPAVQSLGYAQRTVANAIEDAIDRSLTASGNGSLLTDFRSARTLFAKAFALEEAMNPATGKVSAVKIAQMLKRGEPLSGDLKLIGQIGATFPKAVADTTGKSVLPISPLDYALSLVGAGAGYGVAGPAGMSAGAFLPFVRPTVRAGLMTKAGQSLGVPSYGTTVPDLRYITPLGPALANQTAK